MSWHNRSIWSVAHLDYLRAVANKDVPAIKKHLASVRAGKLGKAAQERLRVTETFTHTE